MWDNYCVLALEGGPPHRADMLHAQPNPDTCNETYQFATSEIIRGIQEVSGLSAIATKPGWVAVECHSEAMATWLVEAINEENVEAWAQEATLYVPVGDYYTLKGEIKNVITAVAKTTHYWADHVPVAVKQTLALQKGLFVLQRKIRNWLSFG